MNERVEAFLRIPIIIVSGLILGIWKGLIQILSAIHFIYVLLVGKRLKGLADFCEIWNTQVYIFLRYITFVSNERPFPFESLAKNLSKFKK